MAKAKRETYASMRRRMEDLITRMEKEKAEVEAAMQKERVRISGIIAEALASNDSVFDQLGEFSNADLKRISALLAGQVNECVMRYQREQLQKQRERERAEEAAEQESYSYVQEPRDDDSE